MVNAAVKYQELVEECTHNNEVVGLVLGGSRGKSEDFVTELSDYDIYIVVADDAEEKTKEHFQSLITKELDKNFDGGIFTLSQFLELGNWDGEKSWEAYNLSHQKPVIDKTGEIKRILDAKGYIPGDKKADIIERALDAYMNSLYRSAKNWRDGNKFTAIFDASETLPPLLTALFALEGRVKPYNKYLARELHHFPLSKFPWEVGTFVALCEKVITTGDLQTQKDILEKIRGLFLREGYIKSIEGWSGYYFVGD